LFISFFCIGFVTGGAIFVVGAVGLTIWLVKDQDESSEESESDDMSVAVGGWLKQTI
jgi:hypothetical protein